jgi:2,4-dienoyl-CoA reductase-like NADH-dependent reductase (Old Yellow Enzyme family)
MPGLFEPTTIKSMAVRNRFVRSATWEGMATPDGAVTPRLIEVSEKLVRGGVGLVITGHAYVSREGQAGPWQLGVYSDDQSEGLARMTRAAHDLGGIIAIQLAHAGVRAATQLTGLEARGPSPMDTGSGPAGREMTVADIEEVTRAYALAAVRAKGAGFDAVQIHGAHGYLLSQFLSPYFNRRQDSYGGGIENRARLAVEVLQAIRKAVGPGFPIFIKMNAEDFLPGGLSSEDMLLAATLLEKGGIDAIEMSGGTQISGDKTPSRIGKPAAGETEAYYEAQARRYKERIKAPLMLVGGIRTIETAERLTGEGLTDYIALCRPLIREPGLVDRWKGGDRRPATCVSDNGCFKPGIDGEGVHCVVEVRASQGTAGK